MAHDEIQPAASALTNARTYGDALRVATAWLRDTNASATPDLDAQVLLEHVTGARRATQRAYPERSLTPGEASAFAALVARRVAREPVAYLVGHREFMGLDLLTDRRALIPRPETELLVEAALVEIRARLERGAPPLVADIGTGSGAIALSIAALEPRLPRIYATDVSQPALDLAAENARRLNVAARITFLRGDLLVPITEPVDVLLANLPYIAAEAAGTLPPDVSQYEPAQALYGESGGLGHIRRLFEQAREHVQPGATLFVEFGYDQRDAVETLALKAFPGSHIDSRQDYAGWDRYAIVRTPATSG